LRERLDVEFHAQLLAYLGDGVLPVRLGRVVTRRERRCGGGLVAEAFGNQRGERLAGSWSVWYSCHDHLSLCGGLWTGLQRDFSGVTLQAFAVCTRTSLRLTPG